MLSSAALLIKHTKCIDKITKYFWQEIQIFFFTGRKNEAHSWLRCLVLKPTKPYVVAVFMVDYGTEQVQHENLHKYFNKQVC